MGYRVLEDHLRQGRRIAEQLHGGALYGPGSAADDVWEVFQRALRSSEDLVALLFELLRSLMTRRRSSPFDPYPGRPPWSPETSGFGPFRHPAGNGYGGSPGDARTPVRVSVEVDSRRRTQVQLDFRGAAELRAWVPGKLHPVEGEAAAPRIRLSCDTDGTRPYLRVSVPDDHPAGLYQGFLFDRDTQAVCGELRVWVRAAPRAGTAGAEDPGP